MRRLFYGVSALFVLAVYIGFLVPSTIESGPVNVQSSDAYTTYTQLSTPSAPLLAATNEVFPQTVAPTLTTGDSVDHRLVGMLLHIKWLLAKQSSTGGVSKELFDKQVQSLLDDDDDDSDGDSFENSTLTAPIFSGAIGSNLALGAYYLSGDGGNEGVLIDGAGAVQITAVLKDTSGDAGANGYVLLSTGTGTNWVATSTLGISGSLSNNSVTPDYIASAGQTDEYCLTYESTGDTWEWQTCGSGGSGLATTSIDTSIELSTIIGDETGTGALVFAGSPTFTGTIAAAAANFSGNVGIGTTTPNQKLTVEGNINLSSAGGAVYFDDTRFLYASSTNHGLLFGELAGENIGTTDLYNIAFGYQAGRNADSNYNVFVGTYAGSNSSGQHNYIFGYNAGYNNNGAANFIMGPDAGYNNFGGNNFIFGDDAGYNNTGTENFIFGTNAGYGSSGSSNLIMGANAGYSSTGNNNIFLGEEAGYNNGGSGNILLGYQVANNLTSGNHNIVIGYDIDSALATTSNALNIGNLIFGTGLDGTGTTLSSGNIGIGSTSPSSKLTIQNTGSGNSFIVEDQAGDTSPFVIDGSGNVGIGASAPTAKLQVSVDTTVTSGSVSGVSSYVTASPSSASSASYLNYFGVGTGVGNAQNISSAMNGSFSEFWHDGSGTVSYAYGAGASLTNNSTGILTNAAAMDLYAVNNNASGLISDLRILDINNVSNTGTITNTYGLYLGDLTTGTQTNQAYSIYASDANTRNYFAGNVGIGTTSPYAKLSVVGDIAMVNNQDDWSSISITNNNTGSNAVTALDFLPADGNGVSMFVGSDASYARAFSIESGAPDGIDLAAVEPTGILTFKTGGSNERMRVTSGGNVGIGTTTPAQKLQVFGNIRVGTAGGNGCLEDFAGTLIAGTCSSDEDLKENITPIAQEGRSYLEALAALTPVTYNWSKTAGELYSKDTNFENLGLIAQDVETQFPELVSNNDEGYRQVNFSAFPFYIIEALKEVWAKLQGHDERIEQLEEENSNLKNRLDEIENELNIDTPPVPQNDPVPQLEPPVDPVPEPDPAPELTPEPPSEPEPEPTV